MTTEDPLLRLLARFRDEGVEYVLVGGQAVRLNGYLRATYGAEPDQVSGFDNSYNDPAWRVADVTWLGAQPCQITALHPTGSTTGYNVSFGDWSY